MKEIIKEAATVEEARRLIAQELGVDESAVTFEVQQEPSKKVLGLFGGSPAIVKGSISETEAAAAAAGKPLEPGSPAEKAKTYLEAVLTGMGAGEFTATVHETENGCEILLEGENLGFIIGRRGDTLDAIQYLGSLVLNNALDEHVRLSVDTENYREKRAESLERLARKMAMKVVKSHRSMTLEPMNPYERRIIHAALQDFNGVTTYSTGTEPSRRVVIAPDSGRQRHQRRGIIYE